MGGIDAVVICTPTDTHADLIEAAVSAGKAVFCEKPVDLDAGRIRRCLEVVGKSGKPLMIGFNRRFDPNFAALEGRLRAGEAGAIEIVSVISRDPGPPPVEYVKRSGGLFRDMMIHDFDMARFLLAEEPVEVFALGSALVDPAIGQAGDVDTAAVLMRTASAASPRSPIRARDPMATTSASRCTAPRACCAPATSTRPRSRSRRRRLPRDPVQNFFLERYAAAYRAELDAFVSACRDKRAPSPSGLDGLKARSWPMPRPNPAVPANRSPFRWIRCDDACRTRSARIRSPRSRRGGQPPGARLFRPQGQPRRQHERCTGLAHRR
jgi:myo-inositol 2-dehydrogenase/D-chiro-inositol 1-dehydrogenase